jgi:hypothetical protein
MEIMVVRSLHVEEELCQNRFAQPFTVLRLTAASGNPVLFVVIFASDRSNGGIASWDEDIEIMVDPVKDENGEIILSVGEGNYFPSGPICLFQGKGNLYLPL